MYQGTKEFICGARLEKMIDNFFFSMSSHTTYMQFTHNLHTIYMQFSWSAADIWTRRCAELSRLNYVIIGD